MSTEESFYARHERAILGAAMVLMALLAWEGLERGWWADALHPVLGESAERLHIELSLVLRIDFDALRQAFAGDRPLNVERQLGDRPQIAPLENAQHDEQRRHECEHHADQTKNRHPET